MDIRDEGSDATPRQNSLLTFASAHLGLLVPIIGALIFAFRCVIVSGSDPYVAYIVATETSIGDAIRALLITVLPFLLLISSYLVAFAASVRIVDGNWRNLRTLGMVVVSVALPLGFAYLDGAFQRVGTLYVSVVSVSVPLITFWAVLEWRGGRSGLMEGRRRRVSVLIIMVLVIAFLGVLPLAAAFANKRFWLPRERLIFHNEAPFTGYVLKASEDYLVILRDEPRVIVEKKKDTLEDRDFCYPDYHKARSSKVAADLPVCP